MLVFVDESGDTGLKLGKGSSERFVVTMVVFEDIEDAVAAETAIRQLRHELGVKKDFEFHFTESKSKHRDAFFEKLCQEQFFYFTVAINKAKVQSKGFQFKDSFYKYTCKLVFENAKPYLDNAKIVIDGSGSRDFRRSLGTYLRKHMNPKDSGSKRIRKVQLEDSKKNDLIQLADMVCGAVARSLAGKSDGKRYRKSIKHLEMRVQEWPK